MAGFFSEIEKVIRQNSDVALEYALFYYGQVLQQFRSEKVDAYSKVHAKESGGPLSLVRDGLEGVLQADDFSTSDGNFTANFEEGFLFTKEKDIIVGDIIKIDGGGGVREFRVEAREDIGYTTDMFVKYRLSNRN